MEKEYFAKRKIKTKDPPMQQEVKQCILSGRLWMHLCRGGESSNWVKRVANQSLTEMEKDLEAFLLKNPMPTHPQLNPHNGKTKGSRDGVK